MLFDLAIYQLCKTDPIQTLLHAGQLFWIIESFPIRKGERVCCMHVTRLFTIWSSTSLWILFEQHKETIVLILWQVNRCKGDLETMTNCQDPSVGHISRCHLYTVSVYSTWKSSGPLATLMWFPMHQLSTNRHTHKYSRKNQQTDAIGYEVLWKYCCCVTYNTTLININCVCLTTVNDWLSHRTGRQKTVYMINISVTQGYIFPPPKCQ